MLKKIRVIKTSPGQYIAYTTPGDDFCKGDQTELERFLKSQSFSDLALGDLLDIFKFYTSNTCLIEEGKLTLDLIGGPELTRIKERFRDA